MFGWGGTGPGAIALAQSGGDFSPPPNPRKKKPVALPNQSSPPSRAAPATPAIPDLEAEGRRVFSTPGGSSDSPPLPGETGWAIVLETFKGADAVAKAQQRLPEVSTLLRRSDVSIRTRDSGSAIVLGSYPSADASDAQRDLQSVRAFEIAQPGGGAAGGLKAKPYEGAFLAAPTVNDRGLMPEYDLITLRRKLGTQSAYTVQIGVYDTPDKPEEAKRAAEKAAKVLRDAGEKAFYYHGPRRSVVTIGLFTARDVDEKTGRPRNPEIARVRKDYPLNLLNGQYPIVTGKTTSGQAVHQTSQLVSVP